jgi:hypothetical protein
VVQGNRGRISRTRNDQPTLWDSILPLEVLRPPVELSRVDALRYRLGHESLCAEVADSIG